MKEEGDAIEEPSLVAAGGGLDRTAATTESIPQMTNIEWGKAACSEDSIQECVEAGVFHPGELIEWRAPIKDETPTLSTLEDQFVILSLTHIICGLRLDASDFLVSVLNHYRIEWSHLTPNSITTLSMFAHLCEAYVAVPPTVEVFTQFYSLYQNMRGETTTLSSVFFRLRDNMKNYPLYYLKNSQYMWVSLWFYAKVPQSCRLTFRCDALEEKNNWKDLLPLSHEQEKQVLKITELSNRGLTGADIVQDYLKHRISPLRRRTHLACDYSGPSDPTRDSDKDPSEEDIESKLSLLLDLKKMVLKQPTDRPNVPTRLVRSSASDHANQPLGLLSVFSTEEAKKNSLEEITASIKKRKSSMITYKFQVGHASLRRSTRQSAGVTKTFPKAKKFRNKSFPLFEALGELYDGHTAEGNYNFTSTQAPLHADLTQVDIEIEVSVINTNLRNEGQEADASVQPTAEGETARVEAPSVQSAGVPRSDDVASRNGDEKGPKRQRKSGNIEGLMERDLDTRTKQAKDDAAQLAKEKEISLGSDFSIKRCIYVLNRLEVTKVEKAKAYGVFKNPDNREIFLNACDEDQESALIWLRNEMD